MLKTTELAKIAQAFRLTYCKLNREGANIYHYQTVENTAREIARVIGLKEEETKNFLTECYVYRYMGRT